MKNTGLVSLFSDIALGKTVRIEIDSSSYCVKKQKDADRCSTKLADYEESVKDKGDS